MRTYSVLDYQKLILLCATITQPFNLFGATNIELLYQNLSSFNGYLDFGVIKIESACLLGSELKLNLLFED